MAFYPDHMFPNAIYFLCQSKSHLLIQYAMKNIYWGVV